jgi:hypothetical protein
MSIIGVQIFLICFGFFMLYSIFLHWKKNEVTNITFGVWVFIWLVFLFFSIFPKILEPVTKELLIFRVLDLAMIGSFIILTYLTVENNIKIKSLEKKIETLVRKFAIKSSK